MEASVKLISVSYTNVMIKAISKRNLKKRKIQAAKYVNKQTKVKQKKSNKKLKTKNIQLVSQSRQ